MTAVEHSLLILAASHQNNNSSHCFEHAYLQYMGGKDLEPDRLIADVLIATRDSVCLALYFSPDPLKVVEHFPRRMQELSPFCRLAGCCCRCWRRLDKLQD